MTDLFGNKIDDGQPASPAKRVPRVNSRGTMWNLWHGCVKYSEGCRNCYVYRQDAKWGVNSADVYKTKQFGEPVALKKDGSYRHPAGTLFWTCFSSDFLLDKCDEWRPEAWRMMRERADCFFFFITKRITRLSECLPPDWGGGYGNVGIGVTCENQQEADRRLPVFKAAPIAHKVFIHEPLLGPLDIRPYLDDSIEGVIVGGESGPLARLCRYDWILDIRAQCIAAKVPFTFKQTGARFEKAGRIYNIPRRLQHSQAKKSGASFDI